MEKWPSKENIEIYKQKSANARKICSKCKRESFHKYIEEIQYDTPTAVVWKKIKAIKRGNSLDSMNSVANGDIVTDPCETATLCALHLKSVCNNRNSYIDFKGKFIEACKIIDDEYNQDIT